MCCHPQGCTYIRQLRITLPRLLLLLLLLHTFRWLSCSGIAFEFCGFSLQ
jgi:hypothetical protein